MTLKEAYLEGIEKLTEVGIEEAYADSWQLLEYVTGVSRAMYFADPQRELSPKQENVFFELLDRRRQRIPLQHLTGVQEFMGLEFIVDENVLIPRQDTEILVEAALGILKGNSKDHFHILDLCTGSGCILLSLLKLAKGRHKLRGTGTDISEKALDIARRNAVKTGVEVVFLQSDLFDRVEGTFEMIISNPPYIRTSEIAGLQEEVRHDPYIALDGKEDGLYFYREIITISRAYLARGGFLLLEIGFDQASEVSAMMRQAGFQNVTVKKDLAGLDRVISGVYDGKGE